MGDWRGELFVALERAGAEIAQALVSEHALFVYSWTAIVVFLAICARVVRPVRRLLEDFSEADLIAKRPGPEAIKPDSIRKDIARLQQIARDNIGRLMRLSLLLVMAGLIAPALVIALIVAFQNWFLPGAPALAVAGVPAAYDMLTGSDVFLFIIDQGMRGFLGDIFEVFGITLVEAQNNADNLIFSTFVFLYRLIAQAISLCLLGVAIRVFWGRRRLRSTLARLEDRLSRAEAA
ncbi:MAG: hypothetical protein CMI62_01855 [Parvibaculum sp.]|jgi:hypothetical protein|uniref:hypothetical protein n=1 Tax=Parvibaculum sp. TaxID=2024848 RepID=UPI000C62EA96|nr:hypothetical protein [Parvibaculum sp.]MAU59455.1 hypothetical protein [Parvibaculum sp.]MDX5366645.1 hypothetical protein [Alphaproteobacteria bacterium]MDX5416517.1 hypothetical protein [Alphaproteobacteria bacterium]MDX5493876.1 hypothetical protein [Alphaproteobacteria bacterium]|tara:strand:+ start:60164 stop:60868 length:705 start_codon:yes stop_codon:yes gene_type:complete